MTTTGENAPDGVGDEGYDFGDITGRCGEEDPVYLYAQLAQGRER